MQSQTDSSGLKPSGFLFDHAHYAHSTRAAAHALSSCWCLPSVVAIWRTQPQPAAVGYGYGPNYWGCLAMVSRGCRALLLECLGEDSMGDGRSFRNMALALLVLVELFALCGGAPMCSRAASTHTHRDTSPIRPHPYPGRTICMPSKRSAR
eukprot:scaffold1311_cov121-Isochrysis_galbana.AAC.3